VSVKAATVLLIGASGRIFGLAATQNPMIITLEIATTWGFNPFWDVPLIIYIYILYIYLIYIYNVIVRIPFFPGFSAECVPSVLKSQCLCLQMPMAELKKRQKDLLR